uniref:F-box domain-containing protein n=1 Tax=Trichobilharzia regenti TaxID=157069 RepID=A0AA85K6F6_TRIRE|nr:unnamed protein product [Trichobilharzia regenti]
MNIPSPILEQVFIYLDWNERSRAARVCRKWYSVFRSPSLWRRIVFKPPCRRLTKLQYDIKGYRLSCCLKAIGCHIRSYKFLKSDDLFLLNRTLNLVAKFLEYNAKLHKRNDELDKTCFDSDDNEYYESSVSARDFSLSRKSSHNADYETVYGPAGFIIEGDPDAEATLRLIFELQEHEAQQNTSDFSPSDDDGSELFDDFEQFSLNRMSSISYPPSQRYHNSSLQRSQSAQCPSTVQSYAIPRYPPVVHSFELDFNAEVDDLRGFVYGTGGALLTTISRVIRQLNRLRRLRLVDLFLVPDDARRLVCELSDVVSQCLTDLNLLHFNKPSSGATSTYLCDYVPSFPNFTLNGCQNISHALNSNNSEHVDEDWYLLDPRWLSARPHRIADNPLCDLANLFPKITRLTLSPTQFTGPMLLRLLYQTPLKELILIQTDLTVFSVPRTGNLTHVQRTISYDSDDLGVAFNEDHNFDPNDSIMSELIDWTEDIPHLRRYGTSQETYKWKVILPNMWRAALFLRPHFTVHLKLNLVEDLTCLRWKNSLSEDKLNSIHNLLSFWPLPPAPVTSITLILNGEPTFIVDLISPRNPISPVSYSQSLTSLIIVLEHIPSEVNPSTSKKQSNEVCDDNCSNGIDHLLQDLIKACKHLTLLALGGSSAYVHILTLLVICHQRNQPNCTGDEYKYNPLQLLVQRECCRLDGVCPLNVPATISAWYSTMMSESVSSRIRVAECCLCTVLGQHRWHFLTNSEFNNQLSNYLF